MSAVTKNPLSGANADVLAIPADAEMLQLDSVVRPLTKNGFEFRGGDTFGQEIVSLYVNEKLDEFVMLRYNRPSDTEGRVQPPLIHRGTMAELDAPMDSMDSLRFQTIPEFLGKPAPQQEAMLMPASSVSATPKFNKPTYG